MKRIRVENLETLKHMKRIRGEDLENNTWLQKYLQNKRNDLITIQNRFLEDIAAHTSSLLNLNILKCMSMFSSNIDCCNCGENSRHVYNIDEEYIQLCFGCSKRFRDKHNRNMWIKGYLTVTHLDFQVKSLPQELSNYIIYLWKELSKWKYGLHSF